MALLMPKASTSFRFTALYEYKLKLLSVLQTLSLNSTSKTLRSNRWEHGIDLGLVS